MQVAAESSLPLTIAAAAGLALALFLYQPWYARPFDILDFSEFLPLLRQHHGVVDQFRALLDYYGSQQGRLNALAYAFITLKWSAFGDHTTAWQLARFVQMCGIVAGVFVLLRRLRASTAGAVAGASLFIAASSAAQAWYRLTMGEPLGFLFLLAAALVATGYQQTRRWRVAAGAISLLLASALLAKEMLAAGIPFVLLLACCWQPGREPTPPRLTARNVGLLALTSVVTAAVLTSVAVVALTADAGSFASAYGSGRITPGWYLEILRRMMLLKPLLFPAHLLYLLTVLAGWALALSNVRGRRHPLMLLMLALALPLIGALVYLPWPKFEHFYGLPFLLSPALLLASAVTAMERHSRRTAWAAYVSCAGIIAYSAMSAAELARAAAARQQVNAEIVRGLATYSQRASLVVATPYPSQQSWQGTGETLRRYAIATRSLAVVSSARDMPCRAAAEMLRAGLGRAVLISYSDGCGSLPRPTRIVRRRYAYVDWLTLSLQADSLRADILAPDPETEE